MRVLVTGGAGFIGSHLCERLLKDNHNVFCLDNFNNFYDPEIKQRNIEKCSGYASTQRTNSASFKLWKADIRDETALKEIFAANRFDLVIHLAAMAGVRPSIEDPKLYYDVNVRGSLNLLEECRNSNVKDFIFASSSSVYGNNEKTPFAEEDPVDNPISPYAATKKAGELLCHYYHHLYNMSISCLRFFTVYGPRQRPDLAIHKFSRMILANEAIPVFGDGSTKRDYTFIDDIVAGIFKAVDFTRNNNRYEVFNLGESQTISLDEMIAAIEKYLGLKAKIKRMPEQPGDVKQTFASLEKSSKLLGYSPQFGFDEGMKIFVDWLTK